MSDWPLVHPQDDGIRPAGGPNECFYCGKKIGEPHARDCVIVTKRILMRITSVDGTVTGSCEYDEAYCFDRDTCEYMRNEGSWCADNILATDDYNVTWDQPNALELLKKMSGAGCLCDKLVFKFVRVVDGTPRRALKS